MSATQIYPPLSYVFGPPHLIAFAEFLESTTETTSIVISSVPLRIAFQPLTIFTFTLQLLMIINIYIITSPVLTP